MLFHKRLLTLLTSVLMLVAGLKPASAQGGPLLRLLGQVPDGEASRTVMWYSDYSELEKSLGIQITARDDINRLPAATRVAYLFEIGKQVYYSPYSGLENAPEWLQVFKIDSFAIDRELTVGSTSQTQFGLLEGKFDAGAISQALQGLGYQQMQVGNVPVFSLGADNSSDPGNPAQRLAQDRYNRLVVTNNQIFAASSTPVMQEIVTSTKRIGADPAYAALATALENPATIQGTQLVSAALFDGATLADSIAGSAVAGGAALPRYSAAALGYRRSAQNRVFVIALVYSDAGTAQQAGTVMSERLKSAMQGDRSLFAGWQFTANVASVGGQFVLIMASSVPEQTDIAWVELARNRDLAFLAP